MKKSTIIKIVALSILGVGELFLLYFGLCHIIMGTKAPTLHGVNVDYNTHFMGLHIMGICFMVGFLLVLGVMLFIIFFKKKPKKLNIKNDSINIVQQEATDTSLPDKNQEDSQEFKQEKIW